MQQTLSSFQEIWRSIICENQDSESQEKANDNSGHLRRQGKDKDMGCELGKTFSESTTQKEEMIAFLVDSAGYPDADGVTVPVTRKGNEPANTVVANYARRPMRAFLVPGQNAGQEWRFDVRNEEDPIFTVTGQDKGMPRAFLVDGKLSCSGKKLQISEIDEPARTVVASESAMRDARAWLSQGRVVQMTPRALARFQSFPDWYELPELRTLACRIIGNAVPPLLYEKLVRQLVEQVAEWIGRRIMEFEGSQP